MYLDDLYYIVPKRSSFNSTETKFFTEVVTISPISLAFSSISISQAASASPIPLALSIFTTPISQIIFSLSTSPNPIFTSKLLKKKKTKKVSKLPTDIWNSDFFSFFLVLFYLHLPLNLFLSSKSSSLKKLQQNKPLYQSDLIKEINPNDIQSASSYYENDHKIHFYRVDEN
jgi:hypothetical protein